VLNGIIAVPLMAATMIVVSSRKHLGPFAASPGLRIAGWCAPAVMTAAALALLFA
jgi:Mn2+/Fe2+ NRAMP family transporter